MDAKTFGLAAKSLLIGGGIGAIVLIYRDAPPLEDEDRHNAMLAMFGMAGTALTLYVATRLFPEVMPAAIVGDRRKP